MEHWHGSRGRQYDGQRILLFVYGILKGSMDGAEIMEQADGQYVGRALAKDHTLYTTGIAYMIPAPGQEVVGEVWSVDPTQIVRLDSIEGFRRTQEHPEGAWLGHYRRTLVTVTLDTDPVVTVQAHAYVAEQQSYMTWLGPLWNHQTVDRALRRERQMVVRGEDTQQGEGE